MRIPPAHLSGFNGLRLLENKISQKFLEILARGAIRYCIKNNIKIPDTYDDFLKDIVNVAKNKGMNGTFLLQDQKEISAIYKLFDLSMKDSNSPAYISQLMQLATVKSTRTAPLEKQSALEGFGVDFYELAGAFGSGVCHNRLVFEKMQELVSQGEVTLISQEEGLYSVGNRTINLQQPIKAPSLGKTEVST